MTDLTPIGLAVGGAVIGLAVLLSRRVHRIPDGYVGVVTLLGTRKGTLLPGLHVTSSFVRVKLIRSEGGRSGSDPGRPFRPG